MATRSVVKRHAWSGSTTYTLTGTGVGSTSVLINGLNYHSFHVGFKPGENSTSVTLSIQFSKDDENTSDANSVWTTYGLEAVSAGVGTFTANSYVHAGATAGTTYPFHIDLTNTTGYKVRVVAADDAVTTHGTLTVVQFSNDR
jgi:hypothetical protein